MLTARRALVRKLDKEHAKLIRGRGPCVVCGSRRNITCGHIIHRGKWATRWDTTKDGNCHPQCWPCNEKHEVWPGHFVDWYMKTNSLIAFAKMNRRSNEIYQPTKKQLADRIAEIKNQQEIEHGRARTHR